MSATIQISKADVKSAIVQTWTQLLGGAKGVATSNAQDLQALADELLPHISALAEEAASADPAAAAAAQRALAQLEGVVEAASYRLGFADLAKANTVLTAGLQLAAHWLGVLVKAVVIA